MLPKASILELGPEFYDEVSPASFPKALPRYLNQNLAAEMGLSDLDWAKHFCKFLPLPGNLPKPLALRYHGHQFSHYNPELGDGRGFLFAQFEDSKNQIWDLGTKGSGQTPYSRRGDGRLTLKGAMREALATELLESLGVNTSRTFCFFETGESLERGDEPSPTRSAVLTRFSLGHIRIGTFQRLAFLEETENLKKLLNYCQRHYYPELAGSDVVLAREFLKAVSLRLAKLAAQFMSRGFVHGVLNSDNINISGESFDYGPYRFLPVYDPNFTAAYFDHQGYYSFGRQPQMILWNLAQLAHSLEVAYPDLEAKSILDEFAPLFTQEFVNEYFLRLNLQKKESEEENQNFLAQFFQALGKKEIGFEQAFFDIFAGRNKLAEVQAELESFAVLDPGKAKHPYFQREKPCTLLIDEIEAIWKPIDSMDSWDLFNQKIEEIRSFRGLYLDS